MELKLQLISESKSTEQLSLTQNQMTAPLPSKLLKHFDRVYEGCKACKLTDIRQHDALTDTLRMYEVPYRTKILRKPSTVYWVLLVDNPCIDHGNCDSCGDKLVDISWCKHCGDMGWFDEWTTMQGYWG